MIGREQYAQKEHGAGGCRTCEYIDDPVCLLFADSGKYPVDTDSGSGSRRIGNQVYNVYHSECKRVLQCFL